MRLLLILISVFCAISFLFLTMGLPVFYAIQTASIHHEHADKQQILEKQDNIVRLEIAIQDVTWLDAGEFTWNGAMYDVIEADVTGGILYCKAYLDKEERESMRQLALAFGGSDLKQIASVKMPEWKVFFQTPHALVFSATPSFDIKSPQLITPLSQSGTPPALQPPEYFGHHAGAGLCA
jgi:hypothetical protein